MKDGNQFASPVFKKRFARRKTTHRPFTFARNFETEETSAAAGNPIVSQVGDRGVVITSPVQLSKSNKGLTISEIVRQSPVPVLIAHSTPKEKQKEQKSEDEEEDEANTSQLRRSFRSREPSERFLSRLQYPHGTPQNANSFCTPDEHYIGSKNTSNIDAEVSFTDEGGPTRGSKKGGSASIGKSSQPRVKALAGKKSTGPPTTATNKTQTHDNGHSEGNSSSSKVASTKKSSNRKVTSASTTSSRKGRGLAVLEKTPPPRSSLHQDKRNHTDTTKRSTPLSLSKRDKDKSMSLKGSSSQKFVTKNKTPPPSLSKERKAGSVSPSRSKSKKRTSKPLAEKEKSETVSLRSVDKTLSQSKTKSSAWGNEDQISSQEDLSLSPSSIHEPSSQTGKQKTRSQKEKENRPLQKNKHAASPHPSPKGKVTKSVKSTLSGTRQKHRLISGNSTKDTNHSDLETSSSSSKHANQSEQVARIVSSPAKKKKTTATADKSVCSNGSVGLSAIRENGTGNKSNNSNENRNASGVHVRGQIGKDSLKTSSASSRKKRISHDEGSFETSGPSPEKRVRKSLLQQTETSTTQNQSVRQESYPSSSLSTTRSKRDKPSLLMLSGSQSSKKHKRTNLQPTNDSQNNSKLNNSVFQDGSDVHNNFSGLKTRPVAQASNFNSSNKPVARNANKSTEKSMTNGTVRGMISPRRTPSKSSDSFWKTSRHIDFSGRPRTRRQIMSQASVYDDESFGEGDASAIPVTQQIMGKGDAGMGPGHRKSDRSDDEEEGPKRQRSVVTELGVIVDMLGGTEEDVMEDCAMSRPCQSVVHKAFTFTKKQLRETESQLKQIVELDRRVKKLKSACKTMSSESKEKLQQKFILQKELQSLKSQGIDSDMMAIDQWLRNFQLLRQNQS